MFSPSNIKRMKVYKSVPNSKIILSSNKLQPVKRKPWATNLEKEKLYEDNIRLKQKLLSVQEENTRLKTRILQLEKALKFKQNPSRGEERVEDLKATVKRLRAQLRNSSKSQIIEDENRSLLLKVKELQSYIDTQLKSEMSYLREELNKSQSDNLKLGNEISQMKERMLVKSQPTMKSLRTNNQFENGRMLNRELPTNPTVILSIFFRKIKIILQSKKVDINTFTDFVKEKKTYTLEEFYEKMIKGGYKSSFNELEAVFSIIQKDGELRTRDFCKMFQEFIDDASDRSSDISSPSTNRSQSPNLHAMDNAQIQECIDLFILILGNNRDLFFEELENLSELVSFEDLQNLLLEQPFRVEDGVERNQIIRYMLRESYSRSDIVKILNIKLNWYESAATGFEDDEVKTILTGLKLEDLRAFDRENRDTISWPNLVKVCEKMGNLEKTHWFALKKMCFSYAQNLDCIPYILLHQDLHN